MTEQEFDSKPEIVTENQLDREAIIEYLQELDVDVDLSDWEGDDDNDILGHIATLALMYDHDVDEIYTALGLPIESDDDLE